MVPRQKPLIQTAARGLLWWRRTPNPALQPLLRGHGKVRHPSRLWRRWAAGKPEGAGQSLSPDSSSASEATSDMLSSASSSSLPPNETRSLTLAGTLVRLEKRTGDISLCAKARHADLSQRELALNRALRTSAPPFFPHRSLEEENGRAEGRDRSLKRKRCACAERRELMLSQ